MLLGVVVATGVLTQTGFILPLEEEVGGLVGVVETAFVLLRLSVTNEL